jgi:hypothetical protein
MAQRVIMDDQDRDVAVHGGKVGERGDEFINDPSGEHNRSMEKPVSNSTAGGLFPVELYDSGANDRVLMPDNPIRPFDFCNMQGETGMEAGAHTGRVIEGRHDSPMYDSSGKGKPMSGERSGAGAELTLADNHGAFSETTQGAFFNAKNSKF